MRRSAPALTQAHKQPDPADDHADEQPDGQPDHDKRDGDHGGAAAEQDEHIRHHGQTDEGRRDQANTASAARDADGQHGQIQHQQHGQQDDGRGFDPFAFSYTVFHISFPYPFTEPECAIPSTRYASPCKNSSRPGIM